jgi:TolB-like protein
MYGDIPKREINDQLTRILKSRLFKNAELLQRFLTYAVESTLSGAAHRLKESVLSRAVFDRGEDFDPQKDSIVRTESVQLGRKLRAYYETEGKKDPLIIQFTEGSYVPTFARAQTQRPLRSRTVAVLPFANQSGDPEQDYFCDGITDDIIYALSSIPGLNVIGRTSVYAFRGWDARDAGAQLGAGSVVDGTVRKTGSRVKIFAKMIDTATGDVRWAESFERPMSDVFLVQVEVAKSIARTLHTRSSLRRLIRDAPNMDAYLLFLRGRSAWSLAREDGYRRAAEIFERAVSLFPSYASAHASLSDAYVRLALWGYSRPLDVLPKALRAAETALKLDPFLPHAHSTFAISKVWSQWRWKEGIADAHKAIELSPSYPFGQQVYGMTLLQEEEEEALECFEHAVILDPLSVGAHRILGYALYLVRQFASADHWLLAAEAIQETAETSILLARSYLYQMRVHAALDEAKLAQVHPAGLSVLGACLAHLGRREEALNILAELSRIAETRWVQPQSFARIHLALGDMDRAMEFLIKSLDERELFSLFLKLDPEFDPLRGDPRFDELVARIEGPT